MAAGQFYFTNPEAARQAIAEMQVGAAAAENQSRERIAKEQTASQRYATQSQMNQRDKEFKTDAEIRRERIGVDRENMQLYREADIANQKLNADKTRDVATKERAKVQFASVVQALQDSADDPPTASELEALLVKSPDLTEDQRQAARTVRDGQVRNAKANAAMGQQTAKNYLAELKGKATNDVAEIYTRMAKDPNVIFDRASGRVESAFRMPREDAPSGSRSGGPPTIDDIRSRIGKQSTGAGLTPPTASMLATPPAAPAPLPFAPTPEALFFTMAAQQQMASLLEQDAANRAQVPRVSDFATPPISPGWNPPPGIRRWWPPGPDEIYGPPNAVPQPMPRAYDIQTLRPDYIPMDPYYAPQ